MKSAARLSLCLVAVLAGCDESPGPVDAGEGVDAAADAGIGRDGGDNDAGSDAGPAPLEPEVIRDSRCGLEFRWLPPEDVGHLVSFDTPHSSLTTAEASVIDVALISQGIDLQRDPTYDTLAHRVVYTTQDRGEERVVTGLVVIPEADPSVTLPVLLWLHGTTGLNDMCSPTYNIEDRDSTQYQVAAILSVLASYGYIIVAPDYLGQRSVGEPSPSLHPYLIGEPTAIASLDALDAARELATMVPSPTFGRVGIYGASQGGHAAFFTTLYAPHYAPDIDIGAAVYVIPPSDLSAHMARGVETLSPPSGNAVLFVAGADAWYEPETGLSDVLIAPFDTQVPIDAAADCRPNTFDGISGTDEVFTRPFREASSGGSITGPAPWSCYAFENSVTRTAIPPPTIPAMMVVAEADTLVDPGIERAAFDRLCALGHDLAYLECAGAGHEEAFFYAIDDALDFIDAQLAAPTSQACTIQPARRCSSEF